MVPEFHIGYVINALVFSILGVVLLVVSFIVWDKLTPYDLWREIVEKQNTALAIFAGLMALAIGVIVAASVH
jgi:uncharacterized membrane protein YjfL (UPF0719 family)